MPIIDSNLKIHTPEGVPGSKPSPILSALKFLFLFGWLFSLVSWISSLSNRVQTESPIPSTDEKIYRYKNFVNSELPTLAEVKDLLAAINVLKHQRPHITTENITPMGSICRQFGLTEEGESENYLLVRESENEFTLKWKNTNQVIATIKAQRPNDILSWNVVDVIKEEMLVKENPIAIEPEFDEEWGIMEESSVDESSSSSESWEAPIQIIKNIKNTKKLIGDVTVELYLKTLDPSKMIANTSYIKDNGTVFDIHQVIANAKKEAGEEKIIFIPLTLEPRKIPGSVKHFVVLVIDPKNPGTVEYFDPKGTSMKSGKIQETRKIVDLNQTPQELIDSLECDARSSEKNFQGLNGTNCGRFGCWFMRERLTHSLEDIQNRNVSIKEVVTILTQDLIQSSNHG